MDTNVTSNDFIESLKRYREALINKMENNYQRGDAMQLADYNMFISILEETKDVSDIEERRKISAKYGFFIKD